MTIHPHEHLQGIDDTGRSTPRSNGAALARPTLTLAGKGTSARRAESLHAAALRTLAGNIVTGRTDSEPDWFLRAGGGYPDPWTRDAALNAVFAGLLTPRIAADTLLMVCEETPAGPVIAQDGQWWDQILWVFGASHIVEVTGDIDFARCALGVGQRSLAILHNDRYVAKYGLYAGPAIMQDGITGYPGLLVDPSEPSSFVLDHPATHGICCLSTNLVYAEAMRELARLAIWLGEDDGGLATRAEQLVEKVNVHLWRANAHTYGYFRYGPSDLLPPGLADAAGIVDPHQETLGLAFALLYGRVDDERAEQIIGGAHREPAGMPSVWPSFTRFPPERPSRHNVICWPMVMTWWAWALADRGAASAFTRAFDDFAGLIAGSNEQFFEIYRANDGAVSGGWQCGREWVSEPDQTWTATGFLATIYRGIFGVRFGLDGLRFAPMLPSWCEAARLTGLPYGDALLDIDIHRAAAFSVRVDGTAVAGESFHVPIGATGSHRIDILVPESISA